jgi:DNA-binding GntR family transcriptional regulator
MSLVEPLSRIGLSQQIRDRLLSRIMSGALKPGDRLIELRIASEMATSQAPVREALRELEAMGVIETLRNKGARVRVITDEELRQIYDVRAQLEGYATELVARSAVPLKSKLVTCIRAMKKAARGSDSAAFADHNMEFHRIIVENTGNKVLLDLWESLNVKMRTMVNVARSSRSLLQLAESHMLIVEAIVSGDPQAAHAAAQQHVLDNKPGSAADSGGKSE